MPNVAVPEIQRTSLLTTVLSLKSLPLPVDVLAFDFLDAPTVCLQHFAVVLVCLSRALLKHDIPNVSAVCS